MKFIALAILFALISPIRALAQTVTLSGVLGDKALLIVNGRPPKIVAPGETHHDVKVISTRSDMAVVEILGVQHTLRVGESPVSVGSGTTGISSTRLVLHATGDGFYVTQGQINGHAVQFLVDTGATYVALGATDAARFGIKYLSGQIIPMATANGMSYAWRLRLPNVKVGDVTLYEVDASVVPTAMPGVLLGNSFLSRFQMTQANGQMILDKRF